MTVRAQGVCVLTDEDVEEWTKTGIKPGCGGHRHITKRKATELVNYEVSQGITAATPVGRDSIQVLGVPREWRVGTSGLYVAYQLSGLRGKRRVGTGRMRGSMGGKYPKGKG